MTASAVILRSVRGLSDMNTKPELVCPPPVKPTTLSTAGSLRTIAMNCVSFCCIDWNEMLWSAWMPPMTRPVSCCGKKPLGTAQNR